MPRLLTVREAAAEIGFSKAKVWQWISSGRLGSVKVDGARRVRREDIDAFMAGLADDQEHRQAIT
jgi:excisionase family DNA binding protein